MEIAILVINGPNLNMLGVREPGVYGNGTLDDVAEACRRRAARLGAAIDFRQSNHEGVLIDWIQEARGHFHAIVINAGGLTHTSVAIPDALRAVELPVVEVHVSNIHRREEFRHRSFISAVADGIVVGLGAMGYELAVEAAVRLVSPTTEIS